MERVLSGGDTGYEQLSKENLSTIFSFGEAFMEVVCRDACDGHDVCRVSFVFLLQKKRERKQKTKLKANTLKL